MMENDAHKEFNGVPPVVYPNQEKRLMRAGVLKPVGASNPLALKRYIEQCLYLLRQQRETKPSSDMELSQRCIDDVRFLLRHSGVPESKDLRTTPQSIGEAIGQLGSALIVTDELCERFADSLDSPVMFADRGNEPVANRTGLPRTKSASPGDKGKRPAYDRDHRWLDWYEEVGTTTYHKPAKIRDRHKAEFNQNVSIEVVETGIKKARRERYGTPRN